ncbi:MULTISPECIES: hypothetical protein [unclassified Bradyrhizobium]|uniref:hypothetical protein n=1 Tax=unclassified Bradyrhizobium TaxID=2631580 RepID=UPI0028E4BD34|nr:MULTISPECIES: hypothetical protein [unclassified Bradyrhizobium]
MTNSSDWIAKRIAEAQAAAPVGTDVVLRVEEELTAAMRERALTKAELAELANHLIRATESTESDRED